MAEVVVLGSGAGFATRDRFNTSIAVLSGSKTYILDCGEPCSALLFRAGIDPLSISGIFISHMHPDHVGGLPQLLFSMYLPARSSQSKHRAWSIHFNDPWYAESLNFPTPEVRRTRGTEYRRTGVTLAVPAEAVDPLKGFLTSVYLADEVLPFDLDILPIRRGSLYRDENIEVYAEPNDHLRKTELYRNLAGNHPQLEMQSYSFTVKLEGKQLVFSADINSIDEIAPLLPGADVLILEVAHVSPEEIGPLLQSKEIGTIVLTHIHPALEERVKKLVSETRNSKLILARDGLRFSL
jgi:ribonuclease BN (tRNA processing enzyme)